VDAGRKPGWTIEFKKHRDLASLFDRTIATGTDGRFSVRGIGPEHLVALIVEAQTIEHSWINVMTRMSETVDQPLRPKVGGTRSDRAYWATFVHIAAPSRPIVGTVTDAETGLPLSGVAVRGNQAHTKTNEVGHFQLLGYPKSAQYNLEVIPDDGQPYLGFRLTIDDRAGVDAIQANIKLLNGTLVRGNLTDKNTGSPIAGSVEYYPLFPNPNVNKISEAKKWLRSAATIHSNGKFQVPVLPGPGVLAFSASGARASDYAYAFISAEEITRLFQGAGPPYDEGFLTIAIGGQTADAIVQENYHALLLINPDEGTPFLATDIALDAGGKARGTVLDPEGHPLSGVTVIGLTKHPFESKTLDTAEFELTDLNPLRTRSVLFAHLDKRFGSVLTIRGEAAEPLSVRLQAMGSATGRLVDKDGLPVKEAGLHFYRDGYLGPGGCSTKTDQDGRFRVDGLVPGQKYRGNLPNDITVFRDVIVTPGETKELGDSQAND
jgi:hypothetical protein